MIYGMRKHFIPGVDYLAIFIEKLLKHFCLKWSVFFSDKKKQNSRQKIEH